MMILAQNWMCAHSKYQERFALKVLGIVVETLINEGVQDILQLPPNLPPLSETPPYFPVLNACDGF